MPRRIGQFKISLALLEKLYAHCMTEPNEHHVFDRISFRAIDADGWNGKVIAMERTFFEGKPCWSYLGEFYREGLFVLDRDKQKENVDLKHLKNAIKHAEALLESR